VSLPTTPQTRAGMPPRRARVLVGASQKVGKTTLLARWAPTTTLIVDTQNGTLLLDGEHYVSHVADWQQFVGVVNDICAMRHPFETIGLDLTNDLWRFCDIHHGKGGVPASGMDDYGKSMAKARTAFNGQIGRLLAAPVGLWFLTHLREKTDKKGELVVYVPDLDKNVHAYIAGAVDFLWLAEVDRNGRRIVHTQPTPHFEAGSRVPLPSPLPMDARAIATAMDRALNPQHYDEQGNRVKAAPADAPAPDPSALPVDPDDIPAEPDPDGPPVAPEPPAPEPVQLLAMEDAERLFNLAKALIADNVLAPAQVKMHLVAAGATDTTSVGAAIDTLTAESASELEAAFAALLPQPVPAEATA
jgi:hypothetical protein